MSEIITTFIVSWITAIITYKLFKKYCDKINNDFIGTIAVFTVYILFCAAIGITIVFIIHLFK